ncbi:MAG: lipoprotein insertase outer membrane protein LolB [Rhodanobacteraceae bacterium]
MICSRRCAGLVLLALLAGCTPAPVRPDQALLVAQGARERQLQGHDHWTIHARLGVSDGEHGGSGSLLWVRRGRTFDFELQAPVTGRSFRLHGEPGQVRLDGLDQGSLNGGDARTLLLQALGWQVPMTQLDFWVRGMRAPGSQARLLFDKDGLPTQLIQDGWTVKYRDWYPETNPPLPRRVFASRGDDRVRMVINSWVLQ